MKNKLIAANWKMNGSYQLVDQLMSKICSELDANAQVNLIIFPPFVYLSHVSNWIKGTSLALGAQDMSECEPGAYTGEISAQMLLDVGCKYVLVGHSERRRILGESDIRVAMKLAQALRHGLIPIFCVGETSSEREKGLTEEIIAEQLSSVLNLEKGLFKFEQCMVAYEPVWAIGTGVRASISVIQEIHRFIRKWLSEKSIALTSKPPILYGGSVKPENAAELLNTTEIEGLLVGGASLDADHLLEIVKCTK